MAIKRYTANADNTITNAFESNLQTRGTDANMGLSDIIETFVIYGQASTSSLEESRILVKFPIDEIKADRAAYDIPEAGKVDFYLRVHNAPHGQTLPKDYNLKILPVSGTWEEGYGLDMESYSDKGESNWDKATKNLSWDWDGGDYYESPAYAQSIGEYGTDDIEVNITPLVEQWMSDTIPNDGIGIHVSSSVIDPFSVDVGTREITGGNEDGVLFMAKQWHGLLGAGMTAAETASFDDSSATCREAVSSSAGTPTGEPFVGWITYELGALAASYVDTTRLSSITATPTDSAQSLLGSPSPSCTYLTGSQLVILWSSGSYFDNRGNERTDTTLRLPSNVERFDRSYYIKKFFARGSEHFYLRPKIEARWDSARKDRRNSFYASSSLVPAEDNMNTIFIYNQVRGQLQDIPAIGEGELSMSLYYGASTAPAGNPYTITGSDSVVSTSVVAGWAATGVYSASVAINTTASYLYDVWHNGAGTEYVTGSQISVRSFATETAVDTGEYVSNITNLKEKYSTSEKPRMRMFVRDKDWSPTIYTVATANIETKVIEDAYFKVFRVADDFNVIAYGTGSLNAGYTQMSYDKDGNYFDIDMSLFEPGYSYGIKVSYKRNTVFNEQPELFKFRVE